MKRETTNKIRYILEEILPPILRDSVIFKYLVKYFYRSDKTHETLKQNILKITNEEYNKYYENLPEIHQDSDLSQKCIAEIISNLAGTTVLDVGCGRGFLLEKISEYRPDLNLFGTEIYFNDHLKKTAKKINAELYKVDTNQLTTIGKTFDTVVCTHVLEHLLDIDNAIKNLMKLTKKRLIIIVPRERPYQYTFNGHLNFFPYEWSLINLIKPKNKYFIKDINRDFFYIEFIE